MVFQLAFNQLIVSAVELNFSLLHVKTTLYGLARSIIWLHPHTVLQHTALEKNS